MSLAGRMFGDGRGGLLVPVVVHDVTRSPFVSYVIRRSRNNVLENTSDDRETGEDQHPRSGLVEKHIIMNV